MGVKIGRVHYIITAVLWQYICHMRVYPLRDYHEAFVEWIMDYYARC